MLKSYIHLREFQYNAKLQALTIQFYGHFGNINKALQIFNCIKKHEKNILVMNALMNAYCCCKLSGPCIKFFDKLLIEHTNIKPNIMTYSLAFKACTIGTLFHLSLIHI